MGSEHKSKKRGRSSSPSVKKKSKRKYRNDRSKKSRQSSSESSSEEEEISLTSDEYPSSAEERRKEERKKKKSKKAKRKSRASRSASSSRSPTPDKSKKKSKSSKDEESRSKHKKDRKRSPSSKKSRRRKSRSDDSDSSETDEHSPVKKEKSKKKRSSKSPSRSRKRSVSPSPDKKKKRGSASPPSHRSKKKSSPSPSRKEKRRSRSTTPKKSKSDRKKADSPSDKKSKDKSPSRRRRSPTPPSKDKKKSSSRKESSSPSRHDSSPSARRHKESPAPSKKESKKESKSPVGKSPTPDSKKESRKHDKSPAPPSSPRQKEEKKSDSATPVKHPLKCPSPTSTSKMLSAKADGNKSEANATPKTNGSSTNGKTSPALPETKVATNGSASNGTAKEDNEDIKPLPKTADEKTNAPALVVEKDISTVKIEKDAIPLLGSNDVDMDPVDPDAPVIKPPEPSKKTDSKSTTVKKESESVRLTTLSAKNKINLNSLSSINLASKEIKKNDDVTVGQVKKSDSPSIFRSRKKSTSPSRYRKKSRSPSPSSRTRKRSRSSSPSRSRRRSKSPKRERKRSRSRSPYRRNKSPSKRRRSRSASPRSKKDRDRTPERKKDKRKDDERDKKDREDKDRDKSRRKDDDHRRSRDERTKESEKDRNGDKDRKKKDEKDTKGSGETKKREKSPDKKDINELEEEMKKRKERIEAWRHANRKKDDTSSTAVNGDGASASDDKSGKPEKKWSLEDDSDEEEEQVNVKKEKKKEGSDSDAKMEVDEGSDDDPLDSFMKGIETEVNKLTGKPANTTTGTNSKTKTVTVVKTVVNTVAKVEQVKPEIIEQNQDALEYSSEEETNNDIQASDFTDVTKKKKELTVADHSKIYYAPFRRDFYVEVPELARMTADEVKLMRDNLGDIQVRGKNIPKPIKSWAQAGLSAKIMSVLKKCQYEKPTPIQAQALPIAMSGRDMIGIAKTGSGKTLGFVLPMLRHVLDQPALDEDDGPIAIIMTPTRELALQIYRESKKFCKALNLQVTCIYGGSGISEQIAELKRGTEIIVCTPGRMIDMLAANNGRVTNCRRCTYLVLDEADRMFDMGFEPQVMRIIDNIRPDRQTVLFSATFPRQMEAMARKVLTKPIEVQVGGRSVVCSDVEQHAIVIEEDNKFFKILELLGVYQEKGSILLFVERQETADRLFKDLLKKGYPCLSLHGGMDQFDRDSTIADFKNGVTKLMVSTSVAARGLDVKNLNLVVNFDCPNHYEDYVHRVGRTGRAGNKGTAFTFLTPDQGRNAGDIIKAFELSKSEVPQDVRSLWTIFTTEMEKEGKTIKMNSGFSGKGFKFNAEEDAQVNEEKKMRKFTLGLQDSDDEAEAAENAMDKIEADLEKIFSSKPKVALQPEVVEAQKVKVQEQNVDQNKLKQASSIAALINKKLSSGQVIDRNTAATAHIMQGGALESLTGVGLAKQLADKVNAKLNYKAVEVETPVDEKPTLVRYEDEIDINDFPQQARWRITSKEIIEQVRELSEAGVTVRGLYIPPNKKPTEEERRLHLYIESLSERSIQIAKAEIKRLLKEELIKAESNTYRPAQQTGRYKVV